MVYKNYCLIFFSVSIYPNKDMNFLLKNKLFLSVFLMLIHKNTQLAQ